MSINNLKTVELRKLAGQMGIKGMSSSRKEQLLPVIWAEIDRSHEQALAENTPATPVAKKAPKGAKRCSICETRPVGSPNRGSYGDRPQAKAMGYCTPCLTQAEMENAHSDYGHESNSATSEDAEKLACWICHPELDETSETYVTRKGVSRVGQKMHVAPRAGGVQKAAETIAQMPELPHTIEGRKDGSTTLTVTIGQSTILTLVWDFAGRYDYRASGIRLTSGKIRKVRNVSEALRIANV